jgi:hypothetical protein
MVFLGLPPFLFQHPSVADSIGENQTQNAKN